MLIGVRHTTFFAAAELNQDNHTVGGNVLNTGRIVLICVNARIPVFRLFFPSLANCRSKMGSVIFRCPTTSMSVQGWIAEELQSGSSGEVFISVNCAACQRTHLVNAATGRVLGSDSAQDMDD